MTPPEMRKAAPSPGTALMNKSQGQATVSNDRLQPLISTFASATAATPSGTITVEDFLIEMGTGTHRAKVEKIRDLIENFRNDEANAIKKQLPAVSLSGHVMTGGRGRAFDEGRFQHSGWLQIDLDGKDFYPRTPEEVRAAVGADVHVQAAFLSPTGTGVKALCRIPVCATPEEHKAAFLSAEKHFLAVHKLKIDAATKDPARICFVSSDADAVFHDPATPCTVLPITQAPTQAAPKETRRKDADRNVGALRAPADRPELTLEDLASMIEGVGRPEHDDWLHICSGAWNHFGEAATAVLAAHWPEEKPGEYAYKFAHRTNDHTIGTVWHFAEEAGWTHPRSVRSSVAKLRTSVMPDKLPDLTKFDESDAGNAERVHAAAGGSFHFVAESGQWIAWDGCRWIPDRTGGMTRLFLAVMEGTARQAIGMTSRPAGDALAKYSLRCRDAAKVASGLTMLKAVSGVTISANDLDADPWLVGTPTGLIDLRTGRPMAPDRRLLVTKSIGAEYDADAECPTWENFLHTVTGGDLELIQFLQSAIGYTLTGSNREQCLFFLFGLGCNGKGVLTETLKRLVGDYGQTAPETLFTKDRSQSATNDVARLAGCRLAIAAELEEGSCFAESRIKALTGGDTITARFLHREFFDFRPTHHFWISGNHKPAVRGSDLGIWRRIRLIPFTRRITDAEKDPNLAEKLARELPGILNWALEGCLRWQRDGLQTPQCVTQATEDYRASEDVVGQFLEDCTVTDSDQRILQSSLFECYQGWAEKQGMRKILTATALNRKLEERGMQRIRVMGGRYWRGIATVEG